MSIAAAAFGATVIDTSRDPDVLHVLTAREGAFAGRTLTLKSVASAVVFFRDRPARAAGHIATAEFERRFSRRAGGIDADPPNAIVSILGRDAMVVVELKEPKLDGETLRFDVDVLSGELPVSFGATSLFMEASPGSPLLDGPSLREVEPRSD